MVEIYLLIKWGRQLGAMCREAGLRAGRYQLLMVVCWFGGEFFGLVVGAVIGALIREEAVGVVITYGCALFCAARAVRYPFRLVERELGRVAAEESVWTCDGCGEPVKTLDPICPMCGAARRPDPQFAGLEDAGAPRTAPDFEFLKPE